jgi:hypothetical protein
MTLGVAAAAGATTMAIFAATLRLEQSRLWAAVAALVFAATPLVWSTTRAGAADMYAIACVAIWLACVTGIANGDRWLAAAAGVALAAGLYTTNAATIMMPVYAAISITMLSSQDRAAMTAAIALASAFVIAGTPAAIWWLRHQDTFRQLAVSHHLYDAYRLNVLQGVREMTSWVGLTARSEVYYDYFSPAFLFLTGGVLPSVLIVLVPLGIYRILAAKTTPASRIVLVAFVAAPFAASLDSLPPIPRRIIFITPFAAILAANGARELAALVSSMTAKNRGRRLVGRAVDDGVNRAAAAGEPS